MIMRMLACGVVALLAVTGCTDPKPMRVMTFNVRFGDANDGPNSWPHRRNLVMATIEDTAPDVIGVQEALDYQVTAIANEFPEYAWVGVGREDGAQAGEFAPIFYRTSRLELEQSGVFWLSETPDVVGSVGWDAALCRIVTWARFTFRDAPFCQVMVFNTHFDHVGEQARLESAKLLRKQVEIHAGTPIVVTGDFNARPGSGPHRALTGDTGNLAELDDPLVTLDPATDPNSTFHGFKGPEGEVPHARIDWVLFNRKVTPLEAWVVRYQEAGRYPSDHYPVVADVDVQRCD